jgi:hypothetical protein
VKGLPRGAPEQPSDTAELAPLRTPALLLLLWEVCSDSGSADRPPRTPGQRVQLLQLQLMQGRLQGRLLLWLWVLSCSGISDQTHPQTQTPRPTKPPKRDKFFPQPPDPRSLPMLPTPRPTPAPSPKAIQSLQPPPDPPSAPTDPAELNRPPPTPTPPPSSLSMSWPLESLARFPHSHALIAQDALEPLPRADGNLQTLS